MGTVVKFSREQLLADALETIVSIHLVNDQAAVVPCCRVCEDVYPCATVRIAQNTLDAVRP